MYRRKAKISVFSENIDIIQITDIYEPRRFNDV